MLGRRRHPRFALSTPLRGWIRLPQSVEVEHYTGDELWVSSNTPIAEDELFTLERVGAGPVTSCKLRVTETEAMVNDGAVGYRMRLVPAYTHELVLGSQMKALLVKIVAVRLLQAGVSGCQLQSPVALAVGAMGQMQFALSGELCSEDVSIIWCQPTAEPQSQYLAGAEFVWTRPRSEGSDLALKVRQQERGSGDGASAAASKRLPFTGPRPV